MHLLSPAMTDSTLLTAIAWMYLLTNVTRVVTYIPQIVVVWRCTDGARSVSLLTWSSWVLSNLAATLYGTLVVHDLPFVLVSLINLIGCALVTLIAMRRRTQWKQGRRHAGGHGAHALHAPVAGSERFAAPP